MPRGRPRKLPSLSELRGMLAEGRRHRARLLKERKKVQGRLTAIDREIAMLNGSGGGGAARGGGGRRKRNEKPLRDVIEGVLRKAGKPMKVGEIVAAVERTGYQSGSANFRGIVNQTLIKEKRFTSPARATYTVK